MASLKTVLYLGVCVSAWIITTADESTVPTAENIRWVSLDFKTVLTWTVKEPNHKFSVLYALEHENWNEVDHCTAMTELECDLTNELELRNSLTYTADIQTDTPDTDYTADEPPHSIAPSFNPYRESNISAVTFTVKARDQNSVIINITDPLTSIHRGGKQLSIRDVLKTDLQYKISYYKSGSTRQRYITVETNVSELHELDAGQSYCFNVAAYIPSRPKNSQMGAWSGQFCTPRDPDILTEFNTGAWIGGFFVLLTVLIIIITVTVLCCRNRRERRKRLQTTQSSTPI